MNDVESLKNSIKSAEDLGSVVRTMKTLAAVNIRQYEAAVQSLQEYNHTIRTGMSMLLRHSNGHLNGRISAGPQEGIIVFGSDQGMCGRFNQQVAQSSVEMFGKQSLDGPPVICIGSRAADSLTAMGISVAHVFTLPGSADGMTPLVHKLLPVIDQWRTDHDIGRIVVIHNRRLTASTWKPHTVQLLPLNLKRLQRPSKDNSESTGPGLPYWTMNTDQLFSRLVRQLLFVSLFRACAESQAGENASRIAAMQSAERNIKDRLQRLRTEYAQTRQTAITEELLDVVTGFEALESGRS
jgi:F-type H+-transporting ATPase subunit gamma